MKKVLVLVGPTASGKTKLSILFSKFIDCEIINADSRQVYKYLNIGTAKPTSEERKMVTHHFVDIVNPDEHYDAGLYGIQGREKIIEILDSGKTPVIVGGSGLYIKSLIEGFFEGPRRDENLRKSLEKRIEEEGIDCLLSEIKEIDPETARKLNSTRIPHIIRAIEVFYLTNKPLSQLQKENKIVIEFDPYFYGIRWDRNNLYDRTNERCLDMIYNGLLEETIFILSLGYSKHLKSLQTVGYSECIKYIEGKINYQEMIDLIQKNTRHYVKRQFTWFNSDKRVKWTNIDNDKNYEKIAEEIINDFRSMN